MATSGQGSQLSHPQAQVGGVTYTVDEGVLPSSTQQQGNGGSTEDLVEHIQALEVLAGEPS